MSSASPLTTVTLTRELEDYVAGKVRTGQYVDANDVVQAALEVMREQERMVERELDELRREIKRGIESLDRGEGAPWDPDEIRAEGDRLLEERGASRQSLSHSVPSAFA